MHYQAMPTGHRSRPLLAAAGVVVATLLLHAAPATATEPSCTPELATAAEQAVAVLPGAYKARRTWKDLHYLYVKYVKRAGCDDGAIAEGWSYAVGHLLAYRWGELPELNRLAKADPDFLTFVLRHIDLTLPGEDVRVPRIV